MRFNVIGVLLACAALGCGARNDLIPAPEALETPGPMEPGPDPGPQPPAPDGCDDSENPIYVLRDKGMLYRFWPVDKQLEEVGQVDCGGAPQVSAYTMALRGDGTMWINYVTFDELTGVRSGRLQEVRLADLSCGKSVPLPDETMTVVMTFKRTESGGRRAALRHRTLHGRRRSLAAGPHAGGPRDRRVHADSNHRRAAHLRARRSAQHRRWPPLRVLHDHAHQTDRLDRPRVRRDPLLRPPARAGGGRQLRIRFMGRRFLPVHRLLVGSPDQPVSARRRLARSRLLPIHAVLRGRHRRADLYPARRLSRGCCYGTDWGLRLRQRMVAKVC